MKVRNSVGWISFVAGRYVSRGRKTSPSPVFSVLGIAIGTLALIVIISVMNGFQLGFIESILEMSSCHIRVDNLPPGPPGEELEGRILALPQVVSCVPFREISGLVRAGPGGPRGVFAWGVPPDVLERDPGLASRLDIEAGAFDLRDRDSIVLGSELALFLGLQAGDELDLLSITGNLSGNVSGEDEDGGPPFRVTGIFRCGFYEYDLGWAYINIDRAGELAGEGQKASLGIKLRDRWQDSRVLQQVRQVIGEMGLGNGDADFGVVRASSWRDYNRSFFTALRTEKLMMFILVGLIFVVVGLNIFQAQRRTVLEKREEIGLLRALGSSGLSVRLIFAWDGFLIGISGAVAGLIPGLLIAYHIPVFFTVLEGVVNFFIHLINTLAGFLGGGGGGGEFAIFSPRIFYIKEIPSRVIPREVVLIFLFGLLSGLISAWFASGRAARTRPAEVLHEE
jgi:lipoprotein-releasing system permease protein